MRIKNECTVSPRGLVRHVRHGLGWINPLDLNGISFIRLMDDFPKPTDRSPRWHKELRAKFLYLNGLYLGKSKTEPAHINLYIHNVYRGLPSYLWWSPLPTLMITDVLAHEVGHHLIAMRGYIFEATEKFRHQEIVEEFCDRYAVGIVKKMMGRWYYRLGRWALKHLAKWNFDIGSLDLREKKFKRAAERYLTAFHLDNNREDALYWYRRAEDAGNA